MKSFISKKGLKYLTLAIGLIGSISNVKAADCDIFKTAVGSIIQFNGDCCSYSGVKCENNSITEISLENLRCDFKEKFIEEAITLLAQLPKLKKFEVMKPSFCKFPSNVCQLKTLTSLKINMSFANVHIPDCLNEIKNLEELDLKDSQLNGEIPQSIGELKNLRILNLSNNDLTGYIPYSFTKLENLKEFYINGSKVKGFIPKMPNLGKCDYTFTDLCYSKSTVCKQKNMDHCSESVIEESNLSNGNPNPKDFDASKEVKYIFRTPIFVVSCVLLVIFLIGMLEVYVLKKTYNPDEMLEVTTEKRNKYNFVVSSHTSTVKAKTYILEKKIVYYILGIVEIGRAHV